MLRPDGRYYNFSGTGNTMNCNNPVVRGMVLDCLRYWVAEYHIDGFRFDLASILGRDTRGNPLSNPPLLEALAYDPILGKTKLVAEAWDAGGLYQVGSFPAYGRWSEWNGQYRDTLRRFLIGDMGQVGALAECIQGSPHLYQERGPTASINFITAHDGFTLADLFRTMKNIIGPTARAIVMAIPQSQLELRLGRPHQRPGHQHLAPPVDEKCHSDLNGQPGHSDDTHGRRSGPIPQR